MSDRTSSKFKTRINSLIPDFLGGFTGAVAVLPQTIGLSVLLFTSFGMDASVGAMAGLLGAVILLLSSGIAGATIGMNSAPNGPVTILLTGLVVILMIKSQIKQIAPTVSFDDWTTFIPVAVAALTIVVIFLSQKLIPKLSSIIIGLL
ncbi:MAG: hypothetical protein DRP60_01255 [Spirochaetes bacterium]|nr:MAG: hypothetical protein DRP60_01255 [Spirochaetota bacterium]